MSLPFATLFPSRPEYLANYDYFDVAEGTGVEVYYGAKGDNGEYLAVGTTIASEEIASYIEQTVAATATKYFDFDFDIEYNLPKNIKGDLLASVPMGIYANTTTAREFDYYVIVKASHWDGATETLLGTGTSVTTTSEIETDGLLGSARTHLVRANIATNRHFKKGEKLRITVEGWFSGKGAPLECWIIIGHDPQGRAFQVTAPEEPIGLTTGARLANGLPASLTHLSTQMTFHVPYVIPT